MEFCEQGGQIFGWYPAQMAIPRHENLRAAKSGLDKDKGVISFLGWQVSPPGKLNRYGFTNTVSNGLEIQWVDFPAKQRSEGLRRRCFLLGVIPMLCAPCQFMDDRWRHHERKVRAFGTPLHRVNRWRVAVRHVHQDIGVNGYE